MKVLKKVSSSYLVCVLEMQQSEPASDSFACIRLTMASFTFADAQCVSCGDAQLKSVMKPETVGWPPEMTVWAFLLLETSDLLVLSGLTFSAASTDVLSESARQSAHFSQVSWCECLFVSWKGPSLHPGVPLHHVLLKLLLEGYTHWVLLNPSRPWLYVMPRTQHTPKLRGTSWRRWSILS